MAVISVMYNTRKEKMRKEERVEEGRGRGGVWEPSRRKLDG